jgi:ABC-type Fe3+/spermidine/putrescine transport system ATPase subunit
VFRHPVSEFVAQFVRCENILPGTAAKQARGLRVDVNGVGFEVEDGPEGEVFLVVRPEDVDVVRASGGEGRNQVAGWVAAVVDKGALVKGNIEGAVGMAALMGRRVFQGSRLKVGEEVVASFEPTAAHVFARE